MVIKGGNSGRNEIANNKGSFRDGVCLKSLNGFEWKSLCVIIWTYRLLLKIKLSGIFQGESLWPSYIIGQLTGSVLKIGKKVSKKLFKRLCWTVSHLISIILCQIFLHPKDSSGLQYQCKKMQKWRFLGLTV